MNDKELADRVSIILGAKHCDGPFPDNWYFPDQEIEKYLGFNDAALVRSWLVAGAMMEKCKANMKGPVTIYVSTPANDDFHVRAFDGLKGHEAENESLPRAINEACVEALE